MRRVRSALCRIGWHAPIAPGSWNAGYCFTSCGRCGRDMVRSMFGEWHVPSGFRVVWTPSGSPSPEVGSPAPENAAPAAQRPEPVIAAAEIAKEPGPVVDEPPGIEPPAERAEAPIAPVRPARPATRSPFDFDDFE